MATFRFTSSPVWTFRTKNFTIALRVERDRRYRYDGDDPEGETQAMIDAGDLVAFNSYLTVEYDGEVIGCDSLYGSVYQADQVPDFWRDHRGADPMNRNSSIMRAKRGENVAICHYFPGMVMQAVHDARGRLQEARKEAEDTLARLPKVRESAL